MPTSVELPPFTYIALGNAALVEVENIVTTDPVPDPQAVPVLVTNPLAATDRQPEVPPPTPKNSCEVEAVPVIASTVVVALVVVEFRPVKFCSVDDPLERRLEALIDPAVMLPVLRDVEKRLVDEAVVAKKLVLVELVVVDCRPVKFCRVVEPVARMLAAVSRELMKPLVAARVVAKKLVEVD
jgi:hypothetical protein